jgi:hypothetical protein
VAVVQSVPVGPAGLPDLERHQEVARAAGADARELDGRSVRLAARRRDAAGVAVAHVDEPDRVAAAAVERAVEPAARNLKHCTVPPSEMSILTMASASSVTVAVPPASVALA